MFLYDVYMGDAIIGSAEIVRVGLYYNIKIFCKPPASGIYRSFVVSAGKKVYLGICIPIGDGYEISKRLPVKHLNDSDMIFIITSANERSTFLPIESNQPFVHPRMLKKAHFVKIEGIPGVVETDD